MNDESLDISLKKLLIVFSSLRLFFSLFSEVDGLLCYCSFMNRVEEYSVRIRVYMIVVTVISFDKPLPSLYRIYILLYLSPYRESDIVGEGHPVMSF